MTPGERWLATLWPLVRDRLPAPPARVVDIGCGPLGGFVPMLRADDYDVVGIDPQAPKEPHYQRIDFERAELSRRGRRLHLTSSRVRSGSCDRPDHPHAHERWRGRRRRMGVGEVRPANRGMVLRTARTR